MTDIVESTQNVVTHVNHIVDYLNTAIGVELRQHTGCRKTISTTTTPESIQIV